MARTKQAARRGTGGRAPPRAALAAKKTEKAQTQKQSPQNDVGDDEHTLKPTTIPENEEIASLMDTPEARDSDGIKPLTSMLAKPKRDRGESESDNEDADLPPTKKNKKKYKSKKERQPATSMSHVEEGQEGAGNNFDHAVAHMDPQLLADYFAKTAKRHFKNDTALELEEKYLSASMFTNTAMISADRKKNMLGAYLEFLVAGDKAKLTAAADTTASPHTLVICSSGIRSADIARELRAFQTDGSAVAKLFAKHLKVKQQAVFLRKTKIGFGVGTPDRIRKLIDTEALKLQRLARLVIDGSYVDEKSRGVWQILEIFRPILELLQLEEILKRAEAGHLKIVVF